MKTMTTKMLFFREETHALLDRLSCALAAKGAVTAEAKKWAHKYKSIRGQVQSGHYVHVEGTPDPGPYQTTTASVTLYTQAELDAQVKAAIKANNERCAGIVEQKLGDGKYWTEPNIRAPEIRSLIAAILDGAEPEKKTPLGDTIDQLGDMVQTIRDGLCFTQADLDAAVGIERERIKNLITNPSEAWIPTRDKNGNYAGRGSIPYQTGGYISQNGLLKAIDGSIKSPTLKYSQPDLDAAIKANNERCAAWVKDWRSHSEARSAPGHERQWYFTDDLIAHILNGDKMPK